MKNLFKLFFALIGYELKKSYKGVAFQGSDKRAVGQMDLHLEDLRKRGLDCKMILDVGANITKWSRLAKKVFPSASICLIEPQIELEEGLKQFCKEFKDSNYFLAGAGATREILTFTIDENFAGSSFLPVSDENLKSKGRQREIEVITIDSLIESGKIKIPDLIKLDIQGFELEALKGALKTFGHTECYILEVSLFAFDDSPGMPVLFEVIRFMNERDYVVYDFPGFLRRPSDGALGQCDISFVKRNGLLRKSNSW